MELVRLTGRDAGMMPPKTEISQKNLRDKGMKKGKLKFGPFALIRGEIFVSLAPSCGQPLEFGPVSAEGFDAALRGAECGMPNRWPSDARRSRERSSRRAEAEPNGN
jgi:hypothetical protein